MTKLEGSGWGFRSGWEGLPLGVGGSTTNHRRELHDSTPSWLLVRSFFSSTICRKFCALFYPYFGFLLNLTVHFSRSWLSVSRQREETLQFVSGVTFDFWQLQNSMTGSNTISLYIHPHTQMNKRRRKWFSVSHLTIFIFFYQLWSTFKDQSSGCHSLLQQIPIEEINRLLYFVQTQHFGVTFL